MAAKYVRRETIKQCPIHQAIKQACTDKLQNEGFFSKLDILDELRFTALEDSIRWDYIAEFISEPQENAGEGIELVPLAPSFFMGKNRKAREESEVFSLGRFIAGGHGKKTAGYASIAYNGGKYAVKRAERLRNMGNGVRKAFEQYLIAVNRQRDKLSNESLKALGLDDKAA